MHFIEGNIVDNNTNRKRQNIRKQWNSERLLIKVVFEFASARIHAFIVNAISAKSHKKPTKATKWHDIENAIKFDIANKIRQTFIDKLRVSGEKIKI